MTHEKCNRYVAKAIHGEEILFKDIPDKDFQTFWDAVERNKKVTFNEFSTGIIRK